MEFHEMLRKMVVEKASDLFIKVGSPPSLRIDGAIHFLDTEEVAPQDTQEIFEIIEDSRREPLPHALDVDTSYELPGIGRFRVNILHQRGQMGFVFRHIVSKVPSIDELGLPVEILTNLAKEKRGLVLVTGNTGSDLFCGEHSFATGGASLFGVPVNDCGPGGVNLDPVPVP